MATVVHHRFSVQEYDQMIAAGIVAEDDAVELIHGEIVRKMPVGRHHVACVNRLTHLLVTRLSGMAIVSVQNPIVLTDSEPEPDIGLLFPRADFYEAAKPMAGDLKLIIEVADTSLDYDREIKLPLYARAGIREYWIVNLEQSQIEVYRDPEPSGTYVFRADYGLGESLCALAFPDVTIEVAEILG